MTERIVLTACFLEPPDQQHQPVHLYEFIVAYELGDGGGDSGIVTVTVAVIDLMRKTRGRLPDGARGGDPGFFG